VDGLDGDLVAGADAGYALLDSGGGRKLERIAGILVDRPCPQAVWRRRLGEGDWATAAGVCERSADGGGRWRFAGGEPAERVLEWRGGRGPALRLVLRFTAFGHCGVFFEQRALWPWLQEAVAALAGRLGRAPRVANLFAYTGAASLAMAAAGAEVFHVDSARGVLEWGKASAAATGEVPGRVRWIHDDVRGFLALGAKKGFRYDLVLADPPSWGHGTKGRKWEFDADVAGFVADAAGLLATGDEAFLLLTSHTHGVQEQALVTCCRQAGRFAHVGHGELGVAHAEDDDRRVLPAGIYVCAQNSGASSSPSGS